MEFWVESKGVWKMFIGGGMSDMGTNDNEGQNFHRLKWWKVFRPMELNKQRDTD